MRVLLVGTRFFFLLFFTFSVELEAVGFDCPSKPGFQVEVTLLEVHRLPMGIARQCPQGCGLKLVGFQGGDDPAWCGLIALVIQVWSPSGGHPTCWHPCLRFQQNWRLLVLPAPASQVPSRGNAT